MMECGITVIPTKQSFCVKLIHTHLVDPLLCRGTSHVDLNESTLDTILYGEDHILGQRVLQPLYITREFKS